MHVYSIWFVSKKGFSCLISPLYHLIFSLASPLNVIFLPRWNMMHFWYKKENIIEIKSNNVKSIQLLQVFPHHFWNCVTLCYQAILQKLSNFINSFTECCFSAFQDYLSKQGRRYPSLIKVNIKFHLQRWTFWNMLRYFI